MTQFNRRGAEFPLRKDEHKGFGRKSLLLNLDVLSMIRRELETETEAGSPATTLLISNKAWENWKDSDEGDELRCWVNETPKGLKLADIDVVVFDHPSSVMSLVSHAGDSIDLKDFYFRMNLWKRYEDTIK